MRQNILGIDYVFLMSFLWLIVGLDYQLSTFNILVKFGKKNINARVLLLRIAFFVLWFMAAFRGFDVTNDIDSYYGLYCKIASTGPESIKRIEKGYVILNMLFSKIVSDNFIGFRLLLLFTTSIGYSAVEKWIEKHANSYGICLIAYYYLVDSTFMSANRQMLAAGIILWALMLVEKKKGWKRSLIYILMVLLAVSFHQSAILCLIIPLFNKINYTKNTTLLILIVTALATGTNVVNSIVLKIGIGTEYLSADIGNVTNVTVISALYLALLLLRTIVRHNGDRAMEGNETFSGFQDSLYTYCIALALAVTIMSLRAPGMSRIVLYLQLIGLPYISNTIKHIEDRRMQLIVKIVFGISIWGYSAATLIFRPEWQHMWPYHFFWT